ncbi:hypothetical protein MYCTH_2128762 [Thermothelomyces thermophilus ATCC 42464]|uniref:Uncharacterized protein n=1 Tax=Thermothelomyces thermophilus (strain ATCC 42464 / BCRC 31852 / DSM 1799) TaxID=573729 RepID=G2QJC3_THET4|nr:uncharacterized protein MYCTH_2128762 [Thermothelomyces thermophilus ATCC 42464]AEO59680.1 hypothetical protein MYCTH_2128762 [Thermothelomyces thermophilus ATCC 42464]
MKAEKKMEAEDCIDHLPPFPSAAPIPSGCTSIRLPCSAGPRHAGCNTALPASGSSGSSGYGRRPPVTSRVGEYAIPWNVYPASASGREEGSPRWPLFRRLGGHAGSARSKGLAGGVIGIFYAGAFVIPVGESIHTFFQPKDGSFVTPPFMTFHKHGTAGFGTIANAERFLFNDLDADSAKHNNAYSALPCAYLVLDGDLTLPLEYQEGTARFLSSQSGDTSIYHCPAGHSPQLSWTS